MKDSDLILLGLGAGALYLLSKQDFTPQINVNVPDFFKEATTAANNVVSSAERAINQAQGSAQGFINGITTSAPSFSSITTEASNLANRQFETTFFNNPALAALVGHPEWAYMTPIGGYL